MAETPTPTGDTERGDRHFVGHARTVMALTLVSRVSGMARDAVCSRVFGASPIWSAFVTAFIIPNLFRRLFGEGALSAAFIPEYAQLVKRDPALADRFATMTAAIVTVALGAVVVLVEAALAAALLAMGEGAGTSRDVVLFTANGATGATNFRARALFPPELKSVLKRWGGDPPPAGWTAPQVSRTPRPRFWSSNRPSTARRLRR